jgi:hypothetical protein
VVHGGLLYGDEGIIHQTSDGLIVGNWSSRPAWSGDVGVAAAYDRDTGSGEGLRGLGPGYDDTRWTTSLPYASSWLIAGQHAYVGTGFYGADVHAVRLSDGADVWCTHPEMPAGSWTGSSSDEEVHAVAAGDGLLLVSVGYGLAAYESGGPASSCGQDAPSGSSATEPTSPPVTAMSRPALDIRVAKTSLLLGDRTTVQGQLMGMPITGGQEVIAEVDVWPFDGEWVAGARDRASDGGFVTYRLEPKRNVRVRLRLASDPSVTSPEQTVWADFPVDVRRLGAGGPRPRLRVKVFAYPGAQIRKKVVHAYLLRRGWTEYRRVASRRWQRLARRFAAVSLAYPRGTLGRRDRVVICTKERTPDAFGEPSPYDPMCGAKRLPKAVG